MLYPHTFGIKSLSVTSLFKLTAGLLVFLFILSPLAPIFADEPDPPPSNWDSGQDPEGPPKIPDKVPKKTGVQSTNSTGALTYDVPIIIPPGRNNLQPDVRIMYNSQSTEGESIVGQGWSVPIPSISRVNRTGLENIYSESYFTSTLSDELVSLGSGAFAAKVDNGEFLEYSLSSNVWTMIDKEGTEYTFGASAASRQDNPSDSSKIFKWMLSEVRDTNDNYITYEYTKDQGQIYPYRITYTGHGSTDGIFQVEFSKELKDDIFTSNQAGFEVNTRYRINEIQAKISGSWVRKYELDYTVADNGVRSMLESVTESGKAEDTTVTTLPATTFDYQTKTKSWTLDTNWDIPIPFEHNGDKGIRMLDINGDALMDIIQAYKEPGSGGSTRRVYLNNGTDGWELDENWELPFDFAGSGGPFAGIQMDDVNGDGLIDLVKSVQGSSANGVYINGGDGEGWVLNTSWDYSYFFQDNYFIDTGTRLADVNGDGLADVVQGLKEQSSTIRKVYINDGDGNWEHDDEWTIPIDFSNIGSDVGARLADVNGDGLIDIIKSNQYSQTTNGVYINSGQKSWVFDSSWELPVSFYEEEGDNGVRLADANGDGLIDMIQNRDETANNPVKKVFINTGEGWEEDTNWTIPANFAFNTTYRQGVDLGDVNGDGLIDVFQSEQNGSTFTDNVYISSGEKADLLSTIHHPDGAETSITYQGSAEYKDSSGNLLNPNLPMILQTVKSTEVTDNFGTDITTNYTYAKGKLYFASQLDRKFSGFGKVTETDDAGVVTIMSFHGGTQNESSLGQYADHISKMGKPYRVEVKDSSGNLFSKTVNKWDKTDLGNGRFFVKLTQSVDYTYDGNTSHKDKATAYSYSDTTGNTSTITNWGVVTGSDDGTFSDTGSDKFTTTLTYASGGDVIGLLSKESIANQSTDMVKETKFYYDSQSWGNVTLGNQTKREDWKQVGDPYISNQKAYNSYGLVTSETDPRGKVTSYSYDTYNLYPTTVTNPLSQATSLTYDYSSGSVKQTTDPNGNVFITVYDGLDRPLEEKIPDVNGSGQVTKTTYEYTDTANAVRVKTRSYLDSSNIIDSYTYFDGLKRKIQERNEAATSTQFSVRDFVYNHDKLLKESLPYFSNNSARTTATTDADLYTNYTYDALDRVVTATTTVGTTTNSYNDWKVTVTDPTSQVKDLYRDAYDNLIQVDEHKNSSTYTTSYEYNVLKKLTKLTDAAGNIRNFTYDGVGNILSAQDLHASADTTFGTWSYTYDEAGNQTSRTDPNSQTVNFTYDDTNRVLTENYTGHSGTEVTYEYDTCSNGVGHICEVDTTTSTTTYNYNKLGQRSTEAMSIDSEDFYTSYTYDRQGNQLMINNPDWSQIQYLYDAGGLVNKIKHKEDSDANFSDVISSITYNPVGLIDTIEYHNGSTTTNTYDADELYRLRNKVTTADTEAIQDLTYTYDPVGNITQIVDESETDTAKTTDYTYDDLHRLSVAEITEAENEELDGPNQEQATQGFEYDAIGNITTNPDRGSYDYDGDEGSSYANPHAVTATDDGQDYQYDHNGNVIDDDLQTYAWDYNNRLTEVQGEPGAFYYSYDASGKRIKAETPSDTIYYPTRFYSDTGDGAEKHIFLADTAIASIKGSNSLAEIYTIHADHLTGSNVLTDQNEDVSQITDYYAFGSLRLDDQVGSYNEKRKFTGHEFDADTGLTYMNARYYDATLGRFLSQDPAFLNFGSRDTLPLFTNPQALNSYSYSNNNPLNNIDVSGNVAVNLLGFLPDSTQISIGNWGNSAYANNSAARFVMDHPYAPAIVGTAPLAIYSASAITAAGLATVVGESVANKVALGGAVGAIGGIATQGANDVSQGKLSSVSDYGVSAGKGFFVGFGTEFGVKGAAISGLGSSVGEDVFKGKPINIGDAMYEGSVSALTTGVISKGTEALGINAVPGRYPQPFSASFISGSHAIRNYINETASTILHGLADSFKKFVTSKLK